MTVMTRSMQKSQITQISHDSIEPTIKQLNAFNHCKRWQDNDDNILKDIVKKNVITPNNIQEIANSLGRSYGSIKIRILTFYIKNDFDYENCDNEKMLNKYKFATMEDIEYYALKGFSIKAKLEYRLKKIYIEAKLEYSKKKISNIASTMIDKNNYDKVLKIIHSIYEEKENNLLLI